MQHWSCWLQLDEPVAPASEGATAESALQSAFLAFSSPQPAANLTPGKATTSAPQLWGTHPQLQSPAALETLPAASVTAWQQTYVLHPMILQLVYLRCQSMLPLLVL